MKKRRRKYVRISMRGLDTSHAGCEGKRFYVASSRSYRIDIRRLLLFFVVRWK